MSSIYYACTSQHLKSTLLDRNNVYVITTGLTSPEITQICLNFNINNKLTVCICVHSKQNWLFGSGQHNAKPEKWPISSQKSREFSLNFIVRPFALKVNG